jgi:hypothetical protein
MKIYISGSITGQPNLNRGAFTDAENAIIESGNEAINPHKVCEGITADNDRQLWQKCMRKCIAAMVEADQLVTLDGWEKSEGATLEVRIAHILGMKVVPLKVFIHAVLSGKDVFIPEHGC